MPASAAGLQFIELQLATLVEEPPTGPDWLHEIKYGGYRTELIIEQGKARAMTRRGADWAAKYRPIVKAAAELGFESAIIDGDSRKKGLRRGRPLSREMIPCRGVESTSATGYIRHS